MVPSGAHDDRPRPVVADVRFALALPADLGAAAVARRRYVAWLTAHDWPGVQRDDLVLAVSEAVSNSVEHGYGVRAGVPGRPGVVEIEAEVVAGPDRTRHVATTVRDRGGWQSRPELRSYRRHGIAVMQGCVAECTIDGTADGTTVVLRSGPVPA